MNSTRFLAYDETRSSKALTLDNEQALTKLLSEFGLSEKEAELYVTCLGPGRSVPVTSHDPSERIVRTLIADAQD